jgi:hypothetical protein
MKAQIRGKTRNRGRDWAVFHRPDEKKAVWGLAGFVAGDAVTLLRCSGGARGLNIGGATVMFKLLKNLI